MGLLSIESELESEVARPNLQKGIGVVGTQRQVFFHTKNIFLRYNESESEIYL